MKLTAKSAGEVLAEQCKLLGLPMPLLEARFSSTRKWRVDAMWALGVGSPPPRLAVEIDGAVFTQGRHTRGAGWLKDAEKLNALAIAGFHVLRFTPRQVTRGEAVTVVEEFLKVRAGITPWSHTTPLKELAKERARK